MPNQDKQDGNKELMQVLKHGIPYEGPTIVVDTREQKPYGFNGEVPTVKAALKAGDYSVLGFEEQIMVERKSLSDLVRCVGSDRRRFMKQMKRLLEIGLTGEIMLVVESSWEEIAIGQWRATRIKPAQVEGTLLALMGMGIPVCLSSSWSGGQRLTERFLIGAHRRVTKGFRAKGR